MSDLQARNDAFRAFLDTLNAAQRRAVEQTEGPVLVVAGPGTGKTHVLTARIGKILLDTDARSQNVLCLTFTDAGAHAMRQRLLERIGPEAHRVAISRPHPLDIGAVRQVERDNAHDAGFGRDHRFEKPRLLVVVIAGQSHIDFVKRYFRQYRDTVESLLPVRGDVVAQILENISRE